MGGNDRACALVACSTLETALVHALDARFKRLTAEERGDLFYGKNAAVGTLSARVTLAYALAIISREEQRDMDCIRRIRNGFAHSAGPLSFDHHLIEAECLKLASYPEVADPEDFGKVVTPPYSNRERYLVVTLELFGRLTRYGHKKRKGSADGIFDALRDAIDDHFADLIEAEARDLERGEDRSRGSDPFGLDDDDDDNPYIDK